MRIGPVIPTDIREIGELNTYLVPKPPLVAGKDGDIILRVNEGGNTLYLIGMTILGEAYPIKGEINHIAATITFLYTDGTKSALNLRNGREVCTAFLLYGSSRIDPRASEADRALNFSYDLNWESYTVNILAVSLAEGKTLASFCIQSIDFAYPVSLYGATLA